MMRIGRAMWLMAVACCLMAAARARAEQVEFRPEVAETVADGLVMDFDIEAVEKLPANVSWMSDEAVRVRWALTVGGSAWVWSKGDPKKAGDTKGGGLFGSDMIVIKVKGEDFDGMAAEVVEEELLKKEPERYAPMQPLGNFPATYLIQTPLGCRGIVQIVAFTEKGEKIRYKMIQIKGGVVPEPPKPEPPTPGPPKPAPKPVPPKPEPPKPPTVMVVPKPPVIIEPKDGAMKAAALEKLRWLDLMEQDDGVLSDEILKKLDFAHAGVYQKGPLPGYSLEEGEPFPAHGQRKVVLYRIFPFSRGFPHTLVNYYPEKNYFVVEEVAGRGNATYYGPFRGSPLELLPLPKLTEPFAPRERDDRAEADLSPMRERRGVAVAAGAPGSAVTLGKLIYVMPAMVSAWDKNVIPLDVTEGGGLAGDFLQRLGKGEVHEIFAPGYFVRSGEAVPKSRKVIRYRLSEATVHRGKGGKGRGEPGIYADYFPELNFFMVVDQRMWSGQTYDLQHAYYGPFKGDPTQMGKVEGVGAPVGSK